MPTIFLLRDIWNRSWEDLNIGGEPDPWGLESSKGSFIPVFLGLWLTIGWTSVGNMSWNTQFWPGPLIVGFPHSIESGSKNSILREPDRSCELSVHQCWKDLVSLPGDIRLHSRFKKGKPNTHILMWAEWKLHWGYVQWEALWVSLKNKTCPQSLKWSFPRICFYAFHVFVIVLNLLS